MLGKMWREREQGVQSENPDRQHDPPATSKYDSLDVARKRPLLNWRTPIIQNTTPRAEQRPPHGQPSHLTWQTSIHQQSANKTKFFPQRGQAARFDAPMARTPWKGVWDNYGKKHQVFLDHGINLRLGKCILDVLNTFKSIGSFFFFGKTVICIYQ